MLLARDVIRYIGDQHRHFRVVWGDAEDVVLFDLDAPGSRFERRSRKGMADDFATGAAELLLDHAYDRHSIPTRLSEKQLARRQRMVGVIEPLLARAPDIFDDRIRGRAVADVERLRKEQEVAGIARAELSPTAKTIHDALDRWWRHGMSVNALTPGFDRCGRGERKGLGEKLGCPPSKGKPIGLNVTKEIKDVFDKALTRFYKSNRKNSLAAAYELMKADFFVDMAIDPKTGRRQFFPKLEYAETGYPSLRQFRYWYSKRPDLLEIRRARAGNSKYDKDMRGITGTAVAGLVGPGSRFEIDATKLEVECVSEIDRRTPVGRPTFYQVTDTLTKLVCGIYVGFENASWMAAGLAVRNVAEDKVEFCKRFGVEIEPREWPCAGVMPSRFMADRGEFEGFDATEFTAKSTVTVELATAYRGDQKGSSEKKFDMFHVLLRTRLDGMAEKKVRERGDVDHRRKAILTISEVTAAVIRVALYLNNHNELVDYPRTREMIRDHVPPIPGRLWDWCHERGMTELKRASLAHVEFAMLPVRKATITEFGYRVENLFYKPADRAHQHLFDRARQDGVGSADVSLHPHRTNNVYLHAGDGFITLELTSRSEGYADATFEDARTMRKVADAERAHRQHEHAAGYARMSTELAEINDNANGQRSKPLATADMNGIAEHRKAELGIERDARGTAMPVTAPGISNVVAFKGPQNVPAPDRAKRSMSNYLEEDGQ